MSQDHGTDPHKGIGGHQRAYRGKTDEWLTPPDLLSALGEFDLDPCSPIHRPWDTARQHYTIQDDGLSRRWTGRVWLNPPYGPQTGHWLQKLALHDNGIALIFARTETQMFHDYVWNKAAALLFLRGRLHFYTVTGERAPHNSGGPSVLIAYGKQNIPALQKCEIPGKLIILD